MTKVRTALCLAAEAYADAVRECKTLTGAGSALTPAGRALNAARQTAEYALLSKARAYGNATAKHRGPA